MPKRRFLSMLWLVPLAALVSGPADASTYSNLVLSHGPVAYWRLGESSGATAVDQMAAHNGAYQNGVSLGVTGAVVGDANTAANFAGGGNDRVQVNAFDVSGSGITVLAWFNADTFGDVRFVSKANGTAVADHWWMLGIASNSQLKSRVKINGTTREVSPPVGTLSPGKWYFAAVTYNGATVRIYLDGQQVGSGSWSGSVSTSSSVAIGLGNQASGAGDRAFDGRLDEIAVFNKALTAAQISALYNIGRTGLVGHWRLNETSGTTAADSSGVGNHGTTQGGPVWVTRCNGEGALYLDGVNDYVNVPASPTLDIVGDATLSGWFRLSNTFDDTATNSVVIAEKFRNNDQNMHVALVGANYTNGAPARGSLVFKVNGNTGAFRYAWTNRTSWEAGTWYNFAIVIDADTPANNRVLINGMDDTAGTNGTTAYNDLAFSADVNIGGKQSENVPGDSYLNAEVADFRMYSYALQPFDLAGIYGLVGQWKLDETSGTVAADASASGNNGTYQNGVALAASAPAPNTGALAAVFDGNNDYVSVANSADYNITGPITVSVWINVNSFTKTWQAIFTKGDSAWRLSRYSNSNAIHFACSGLSVNQVNGSADVNDGQWHHVAGVFDGSTLNLYIDGQLDASVSSTGSIATNGYNVEIGRNAQASGREFHGALYDARVFNRALCPEEILALYGSGAGAFQGVKIIKWIEVQ